MTYGADFSYAHWLKPAGQNTVREHAENLVTDLVSKRYRTETLNRPIIFVAYSLGGLVCKNVCGESSSIHESRVNEELLRPARLSYYQTTVLRSPIVESRSTHMESSSLELHMRVLTLLNLPRPYPILSVAA